MPPSTHKLDTTGYTIFAVIQRDPAAPLALPRTTVDEMFGYIEEPTGHHSHSYAAAAAAGASSSQPHIEGFEDEDMELQAALQASLGGGDYGDYLPQRFPSSLAPGSIPQQQQQQLPRGLSGMPMERTYDDVIEVEDEDEDAMGAHVLTHTRVQQQHEPADQVLASMARQRAVMEQMRREQEVALQEQYEEEIARIEAAARARRAAGADASANPEGDPEEEDEDAMLRRAMAESEAMAQTYGSGPSSNPNRGSGSPPAALDDGGGADTPHGAPAPASASGSGPSQAWLQHRVYDDEDAELQAALRASLETVPAGFRVPSPPPIPTPPAAAAAAAAAVSSLGVQEQGRDAEALVLPPAQIHRQPSSDVETESDAGSEAAQAVQPSLEEIRRMRLARFGG